MGSKLNVIDSRNPEYNYRQQENDFPKTDSEKRHPSNKAIRVVQAALPFVALCKPLGRPFALVMGGSRAITCLSKTYTDILERKGRGEIAPGLLQSTVAVIALGGTLFAHPLGMLVTTCHDIGINIIALRQAWLENDSDKAKEVGLQLLNNCFYMGLFFTGYTELLVASFAMQILTGAFHSYQEYSQRNYIEAVSGALMVIVRMNQAAAPVNELHQKWKAAIQSRKEAIISCNTAKADIGVSRNSSPELVDILVKYGNNPKGIPPLHYAVLQGDFPAVKLLVENGANVNLRANNGPPRTDLNDKLFAHKLIRYYQGATPIDYAATSSRLEILQYLHQHGAILDEIAVIKTARASSLECLKYLLSNGASLPKESGELMYEMLFSAAGSVRTGNIEAVKILIRAGADCTYTYTEHFTSHPHGETPFVKLGLLSLDSTLSDLELVKLLVEHGAPINYAMERIRTKKDPKELQFARPKLIWDIEFNPLCRAVQQGKEEAAAYLLSVGALLTNHVQHQIWEMSLATTAQGKAQRKIALNLNMFNKEYIQCLFDRLITSPLFDVIDFQDLKELHKRGAQIRNQNLRDASSLGEKGRELIAWLLSNGAKLQ